MAVERMEMMNLIGYIGDLNKVSKEVVRCGCVHIVNALNEINDNDFTVLTPDQNTSILKDLCFIKSYSGGVDYSNTLNRIVELMETFSIDMVIRKKYVEGQFRYKDIEQNIEAIYKEVTECKRKIEDMEEELAKIRTFQENIRPIKELKLDFNVLKGLKFFNFSIGRLSKENYEKLKDNIENISSIIYELRSIPNYQFVVSLTPKVLQAEVDRIFKSLNYEEINIPYDLGGTPEDIIKKLDEVIGEKEQKLKELRENISCLREKYAYYIDESYSRIKLYEKVKAVNSEVACTNEFFYMAGWVPVSQKKNLQKRLSSFGDRLILYFKPQSDVGKNITPPTRLKNNWFVRPFETLIGMYGTPSYNEMDPTSFVAISYMIMFGAMFGDIGQGFIFLLAGLIMSFKNRDSNFGGILSRLGISSMFFGALFGSIFGDEEIIHPLLIKPMDNINAILAGGVVLGVIFTTVGFIYSLINAVKRRDLEDGVFGKDGLVGLVFYWITLLTALSIYMQGQTAIPLPAIVATLCILLALMVLKQPIANLIMGNRPLYHEPVQDYYIESGFGVIETLLSMLSNTISFIRVGAFALNHVGLFIAFATIANLMKTHTGSIAMLVLGNIIIIGLEGLIVFIQGLRLEYYELFSKYYKGDGIEYRPVELKFTNKMADVSSPHISVNHEQSINI